MEKLEKIPLKGPEGVYYDTSRRHEKAVVKRFTEHCSLGKIQVEETILHAIYSCPVALPREDLFCFAESFQHSQKHANIPDRKLSQQAF